MVVYLGFPLRLGGGRQTILLEVESASKLIQFLLPILNLSLKDVYFFAQLSDMQ